MIIYLLNILLVDDDRNSLRITQKYFESKGARVSAYSDPLVALQDLMKNGNSDPHYNLIISDIKMPKMDGIELASKIRNMNKDIAIILMADSTTNIADIDQSILKFLVIEDIITKPIQLKYLIEKINTIKQEVIIRHQY